MPTLERELNDGSAGTNVSEMDQDLRKARGSDREESQKIAVGVEQRHGLFLGAMQCSRVDDANAANPLIVPDVRVPMQQVIVPLLGQETPHRGQIIAMKDREVFAAELERARGAKRFDMKFLRVAVERAAVPVVVAPDERRGRTGQLIEYALGADVAAMNEELRPERAQMLDGQRCRLDAIVSVTQDSDEHECRR